MFFHLNGEWWLSGLILLVALIDDLRSRKIHNQLILFMLPFVLIAVFWFKGWEGIQDGGLSALLALLIAVPLAMAKIIGGGDLKLLVLLSLTLYWTDFFRILIYSFPWAFVLGIFKIILDKKLKEFFLNLMDMLKYKMERRFKLHSIPFSVALFVAWMSFMVLKGMS